MGRYAAAALVFGASASVLVVEVVALRLLAPYFGLTLETSTLVIGVALAAIALGSWAGGRAADLIPPRRALGPLLAVSGVAVAATPFAMRAAGAFDRGVLLMLVSTFAIIVPGTFLAAVTPMVTKLRLTTLNETGTVVGRLSAIGTAGAIVGTVVTGFVLISRVPVSGIMVGLGAVLVLGGALVEFRVRGSRSAVTPAVLVIVAGGVVAVAPGGCDVETIYHCAVVVKDQDRASGRVLMLDGAPHSYVDLDDPTYLDWDYAKAVASVIDTEYPEGEPLRAYHIGGGGLTLPRYLERVRPGTSSLVSEIDPGVVKIDNEEFGLASGKGIEVRVEDARLGLGRLADDSRDLVLGDAFGGVSVPWHLTTRETVREIASETATSWSSTRGRYSRRADRARTPPDWSSIRTAPGSMCRFAQDTVALYASLELDGEPGWYGVGGLEVATTPERMRELHRRRGWATSYGIEDTEES